MQRLQKLLARGVEADPVAEYTAIAAECDAELVWLEQQREVARVERGTRGKGCQGRDEGWALSAGPERP